MLRIEQQDETSYIKISPKLSSLLIKLSPNGSILLILYQNA